MEKTPRYTQRERNMVLGFAAQYKDVIENKRTDAESNRKKDEVWRQIAKEFNARVYHQRSSKQLRQLYKNMKLLLKKDLCGEGKGNRSFMDLLNTLSQQESVTNYISEQMSPSGGAGGGDNSGGNGGGSCPVGLFSSRQQKYEDDYEDSKLPSIPGAYEGLDNDVIVIKSEDISDNDQSQNGLDGDEMDDDDCLSTKDIPEVCLEEEDDEIFATDVRSTHQHQQQSQSLRQQLQRHMEMSPSANHQNSHQKHQQQQHHQNQSEVTIRNVGGIRVGSFGSIANMKVLQNGNTSSNSALSLSQFTNANNNNSSNNISISNTPIKRPNSTEQTQQQLLLSGLGLSPTIPNQQHSQQATDQTRGCSNQHRNDSINNNNNGNNNFSNQLLLNLNDIGNNNNGISNGGSQKNSHLCNNQNSNKSDYLMTLAIEESKRKIDLINAQIEYWKTLTKKLDTNIGNPIPTCLCHFPGKANGLQTQSGSS